MVERLHRRVRDEVEMAQQAWQTKMNDVTVNNGK
jgi:hypothetical protein